MVCPRPRPRPRPPRPRPRPHMDGPLVHGSSCSRTSSVLSWVYTRARPAHLPRGFPLCFSWTAFLSILRSVFIIAALASAPLMTPSASFNVFLRSAQLADVLPTISWQRSVILIRQCQGECGGAPAIPQGNDSRCWNQALSWNSHMTVVQQSLNGLIPIASNADDMFSSV